MKKTMIAALLIGFTAFVSCGGSEEAKDGEKGKTEANDAALYEETLKTEEEIDELNLEIEELNEVEIELDELESELDNI